MPVPKAPGRLIGDQVIILGPHPPEPYRRADGSRLDARIIPTLMGDRVPRFYLAPGEDLLWGDFEVYGGTEYMARGTEVQRWLGLGIKTLPEHTGLEMNTLIDMGYRFTLPRGDVEPLIPLEAFERQQRGEPSVENPPLPEMPAVPPDEPAPVLAPEPIADESLAATVGTPASEPAPESSEDSAPTEDAPPA